jgi:hypothetical protein
MSASLIASKLSLMRILQLDLSYNVDIGLNRDGCTLLRSLVTRNTLSELILKSVGLDILFDLLLLDALAENQSLIKLNLLGNYFRAGSGIYIC